MTPDEKDKWIALIEGIAAGGQLQRYFASLDSWSAVRYLDLGLNATSYRIKPREPRSVETYMSDLVFSDASGTYGLRQCGTGSSDVRVRITEILE